MPHMHYAIQHQSVHGPLALMTVRERYSPGIKGIRRSVSAKASVGAQNRISCLPKGTRRHSGLSRADSALGVT